MRLHSALGLTFLLGVAVVAACATGSTADPDDVGTNGPGVGAAGPGPTSANGAAGPGPTSDASTSDASSTSDAASTNAASTSANSTVASTSVASTNVASSSSGCTPTNVLVDGGLEAGPQGGQWIEGSTNFGTPICDVAGCGMGGSQGPYAGTYWAWFGGVNLFATLPEVATLQQSVTIPVGTASLDFMFEIPVCDSSLDTFTIKMDNAVIFSKNGGDSQCGVLGYTMQSINLNAYANGGVHTLLFTSTHQSFLGGPTNFMVDNIQLIACL